jgi:O-methyltransferase
MLVSIRRPVKPDRRHHTVCGWTAQLVLAVLLSPLLAGYNSAAAAAEVDSAPDPAHSQRAVRSAPRVLRGSRRRVAARGIDAARRLRLTRLVHRAIALLPRPIAERVDNLRRDLRMRAGDPAPAAHGDELEPTYDRLLRFLADRHPEGATGIGDYLEFGVYVGTTMTSMHRALNRLGLDHVRLYGFDSFEGLPETARTEEDGYWRPGMYRADIEVTQERLTAAGVDWNRVRLVKGWFDETLDRARIPEYGIGEASVVMVDCDLYSSTKTALDFCEPLLAQESILIFDDWRAGEAAADDRCVGERAAFEEFLDANPHFTAAELPEMAYSETSAVFRVRRNGNQRALAAAAAGSMGDPGLEPGTSALSERDRRSA